ncbi:MAG: copper chaperone PCu(A)C [Eikenella sp.]|nr:copper chaperone PCu(A)C [Eikenella sp.]
MKKACLTALALAAAGAAQAEIYVRDAWARFTVPGQQAGGVFMQLHNDGRADALVGGSSPLAEKVEIHTHSVREGKMQMHEIEGGLPLAEGGRVELKPGSYHVMLIGLKQPLTGGKSFPLTLNFRHAPAKTVTVTVKTPTEEAAGPGGHEHPRHHGHSH